jgi:hypothetical protein
VAQVDHLHRVKVILAAMDKEIPITHQVAEAVKARQVQTILAVSAEQAALAYLLIHHGDQLHQQVKTSQGHIGMQAAQEQDPAVVMQAVSAAMAAVEPVVQIITMELMA